MPSPVPPAFRSPFMSECLCGANIHWSDVMWTGNNASQWFWDEYDKNTGSPALSKENMSNYKSISLKAMNSSSSQKTDVKVSKMLLYVILAMNGWCLHGSLGEGMNEWLTRWMGGRCVLGGFEWMIGDRSPEHEGMGSWERGRTEPPKMDALCNSPLLGHLNSHPKQISIKAERQIQK